MREHLKSRLGWQDIPVVVDNDANLSALAEHIFGAGRPSRLGDRPPYDDIIYVEWSQGIGAGLILGGELYRGRGVAGEIGHTVLRPAAADEPVCDGCGHAGCLERVAGWDAILGSLNEFKPHARLTLDDLIKSATLANKPNSQARKAFTDAAENVAKVLGPAIHFLNPQLVIIGGDIGRYAYGVVQTPLAQSLRRYTMRPALSDVAVDCARLSDVAVLQGGIALVLRSSPDEPDALLAFLQRKAGPRPASSAQGEA